MYGVALLILVAVVSLLVTRLATIALVATGLARPAARFQARSALSGVGFTTSESEAVVGHPARRRIIMMLMLLGSAGLATSIAGLLAGLAGADSGQTFTRVAVLVSGLAAVYAFSTSRRVDRRLSQFMGRLLARYTDLDVRDYEAMLHVSGEYEVKEMQVTQGSWFPGRTLGELRLRDEGVLVLGVIRPDGSYLGVPGRQTRIEVGDTLVLYGRDSRFTELTARRADQAGDEAHRQAVADQQGVAAEEAEWDAGRSAP